MHNPLRIYYQVHIEATHEESIQPEQSLSYTQTTAHVVSSVAEIDTAKAATTARTKEKRIVCEDAIGVRINLKETVGGRLTLYAEYWYSHELSFEQLIFAMPADCYHCLVKHSSSATLQGTTFHPANTVDASSRFGVSSGLNI